MWVVQYGSVYEKKPSLIELRDNLKAHYKNFNGSDIEVLYTRTFDYFPRFNMTAASKGYHWDLYDMQGKLNLYFIGGGCSFESVHNVIGYNNLLLDHMPMPAKNCSALWWVSNKLICFLKIFGTIIHLIPISVIICKIYYTHTLVLLNIWTELLSNFFSWFSHMRRELVTQITPRGWIFWVMIFFIT